MPAAPACQMVRKAGTYVSSGSSAVSSKPWPRAANPSTATDRAARASGAISIGYESSQAEVVITPSWNRPSPRTAAANRGASSPGARSENWCRGCPPRGAIIASRSRAASVTVRASGPATLRPPSASIPDADGTRPREGFTPTRPQAAAGIRTEPPPSEPGAKGSSRAATATAAPPLDPPAPRERSHGLRAGGPASVSVYDGSPNSGVLVLPRLTPPASSRASTRSSDSVGTLPCISREPNRAGTPARLCRSLSAKGRPQSSTVRGTCCSTKRARVRAASAVTVANAPRSGSCASIRPR